MKKTITLFCSLAISFLFINAQVAINTTGASGDASAMLDVSGTKGMLIPRMTFSQRNSISSPANGLLIYQTDNNPGFYFYNGAAVPNAWQKLGEFAPGQNGFQPYLSGSNNFTVPSNITRIYFEGCSGGGGHGGNYAAGGSASFGGGGGGGGFVRGYITVTPGQMLTVNVGAAGTNGTNGSGATSATNGNDGGITSVYDGASEIFIINGATGGYAAAGSAGTGGFPGNYFMSDATVCKILDSHTGLGGMTGNSGLPGAAISNDLSGLGGMATVAGSYNFFAQFLQNILIDASSGVVSPMYYTAPYYGRGGGRGDVSTPGYVYLYW